MNRPALALFTLLAGLAPPAAAHAADVTRTLKAELPATASGKFRIENLAGAMKIRPGSGRAVVAVATVHAESDELAELMRFEQVKGSHGEPTLRVIYPLDKHRTIRYPHGEGGESMAGWWTTFSSSTLYGGQKYSVTGGRGPLLYADVEVQVPAGDTDAVFRNVVGALHAEGLSGKLFFDTGSGDVEASDLQGSVRCDTGSGNCDISNVRGRQVACDTGSGDITLRTITVTGSILADTGSGVVRGSGLEGSFTCDTGSGDCIVEDLQGASVRCDTGSGDVTLRAVVADRIEADTGSGNVAAEEIDVKEFLADTGSGEVLFQARGARLARLSADTGSGSITLRLGAGASFHALASQGSGDLVSRYADAKPILRDRELVGYERGSGGAEILVDSGSGNLILEPGPAVAPAAPGSAKKRIVKKQIVKTEPAEKSHRN